MFLFNRKRPLHELLPGMTDWHSHILPGADDGIRHTDEALRVLADYARLGISEVWLTPHVAEDCPNTPAALGERFAQLRAAMAQDARDHSFPTLHLASEHMLDNLFRQRLEKGDLLTLGADRLLVETSYFTPPMDFEATLRDIMSKGYRPVLAHPERYQYMELSDYCRLHAMGVMFQLNLPSLAGLYGPEPRRKARLLLGRHLYTLAGSDLHRPAQVAALTARVPRKWTL